ncbi:xanthine dehydrogenase family protein molybdopterin-binding subunit [Maliponia aquimaris]|uniref:Membrane-bound aldehyde dehydrogenase [pyrroloquinoline-quinone] n=1 Tax=Maliponia aquimaris TaxID=1673631 RepID=A0A238JTE2_9RHOB|nr:molybdopterin cofactor-binding domain-containing protein [Maliponia aquimaris]SMX33454.1 Membrane-bound aldehyde dehydrogenase [pyrroloquinoline-quinone] precursor [Maliponia aquimaris]
MLKYIDSAVPVMLETVRITKVSRRGFLGTTGAFAIAAYAAPARAFDTYATGAGDMPHGLVDNPLVFVSIDADGTVTLVAHRSEMGTGSRTSLPMVIADEMEADWSRVKIIQAPGDEPKYGNQDTDGSRSLRHHIQAARKIGGSVRTMLARAAATEWGVEPSAVTVEMHEVKGPSGQVLGFGELAEAAMALPVPSHEEIAYKSEDQFRYIGKGEVQITDLRDITTGQAVYGADVVLDGMKFAVIARPPVVGGRATSYDATEALAVPGVVSVHEIPYGGLAMKFAPLGGIAVVATNTWAAIRGRERLKIEWEAGPHGDYTSERYMAEMVATSAQPGSVSRDQGNVDDAFANAAKTFAQTYTQAHMAHIPMEPPAAIANYTGAGLEIWAPVQSPYTTRTDTAEALGLDPAKVTVNVTLLGGGFGRKSKADYVTEAALLSREVGAPVRVQWTREDDVRHSFYHTTSAERIEVAMDESGKVTGWLHRSVAPSILSTFAPDEGNVLPLEQCMGMTDVPFDIPNIRCESGKALAHTRIGWFRAVSNIPHAWAIGSFVGELANELGKNQKEMWLELIGAPRSLDPVASAFPDSFWNYGEPLDEFPIETGRLANVLTLAADGIGYGKELPEGEGIGLAVHRSFVSYVACAAHVKVSNGRITVPEMHMAIDCGFAANPERIESQMQGAAVMGMTVALHSGVTFENGAVVQSNFYDYDTVRSDNFPVVVTHIVPHPFEVHATGVGEPGVPPVAPAIANGLFAATGDRRRALPLGTEA